MAHVQNSPLLLAARYVKVVYVDPSICNRKLEKLTIRIRQYDLIRSKHSEETDGTLLLKWASVCSQEQLAFGWIEVYFLVLNTFVVSHLLIEPWLGHVLPVLLIMLIIIFIIFMFSWMPPHLLCHIRHPLNLKFGAAEVNTPVVPF